MRMENVPIPGVILVRIVNLNNMEERLGEAIGNFYDKALLDLCKVSLLYTGKFRKKRVPKYLKIKIPIIRWHFCEDSGESGLFITTREISLFKIGTEVIRVPVMRKFKKGAKVKFRRYSKL